MADIEHPKHPRGVQEFFCLSRILPLPKPRSTNPANPSPLAQPQQHHPPLEATRTAACPSTGKRQVGILPACSAVPEKQGTQRATQQQTSKGSEKDAAAHLEVPPNSLPRPRGKPMATPLPPDVPKPAMIRLIAQGINLPSPPSKVQKTHESTDKTTGAPNINAWA